MKFRIGYGGPKQYPHGQYRPGGRHVNGGMTEIERLIHLVASMQILFGSRRGSLLVPLLIIGLAAGGWYFYRNFKSPEKKLERAHAMFNSSDSNEKREAIDAYQELLNTSDPLEPGRHWLRTDRDTLYRRIIQHELINAEDADMAAEWSIKAIEDGFTKLRFQNERVKAFWEKTLDSFRQKKRDRPEPSETLELNGDLNSGGKPAGIEAGDGGPARGEGSKFDNLPGIDDVRCRRLNRSSCLAA